MSPILDHYNHDVCRMLTLLLFVHLLARVTTHLLLFCQRLMCCQVQPFLHYRSHHPVSVVAGCASRHLGQSNNCCIAVSRQRPVHYRLQCRSVDASLSPFVLQTPNSRQTDQPCSCRQSQYGFSLPSSHATTAMFCTSS